MPTLTAAQQAQPRNPRRDNFCDMFRLLVSLKPAVRAPREKAKGGHNCSRQTETGWLSVGFRSRHSMMELTGMALTGGGPSRTSLHHLVGAGEERRRDVEGERFCGLEIDDQFELRRLLDR